MEIGPGSSRRGLTAAVLLVSIGLTACGTLPTNVERTPSMSRTPAADSPLVQMARDSSPGPSLTGFRLMPDGFFSLDARIQLARRARHSLDVQYYLIENDRTGRLLLRSLRDAALRGVRLRLLVDDLYTAGADPMFRDLAAFANVEVRLFNPFCCARRSIAGKYLASIAEVGRLNHRMHNKLFLADEAMAIMGGRNVADEYFSRSLTDNFVDMDVFLVGPVVARLAGIFDVYWNSPQAYPVGAIVSGGGDPEQARRGFVPGAAGVRQFVDLRARNVSVVVLTNSSAATDVPAVHAGYARYRRQLLESGVELYELSPTRVQKNERLMLPVASVGRLHAKTAVIDQSVVYIGSMNLDPRSEGANTELGLVAECPELAREVIRVIAISKLKSAYRVRLGLDGRRLEWAATDNQGDVVFTAEPEVTPFARFKNMLFAPFVPEQLL